MLRHRLSERPFRLVPAGALVLVRTTLALGLAAASGLAATTAGASEFWDNTYVVGITQGSSLTEEVDRLGAGGYELSDGTKVNFQDWYGRQWTDVHVEMLTELTKDFGVVWGLSSGESGPKYKIYPGLQIGLMWQIFQNGNSDLTLSVTEAIGGNLVELPCVADYGAVGGVQEVNCRLAATSLPPQETLQYLVNMPSPDAGLVSLSYTIRF
jgi:hypothetical protein